MQNPPSPARQVLLDRATSYETTPFDYVIIGSGAGGGPLAARLARAGRSVLVLEAGGDPALPDASMGDPPYTTVIDPKNFRKVHQVPGYHAAATEDAQMSWAFSVRHYADDKRQERDTKYKDKYDPSRKGGTGKGGICYPRCAALGGCTAHHAMIIIAPNDRDWNEIAELTGDASWRAEHMQGYFTRLEKCLYRATYQNFFQRLLGWIFLGLRWLVGFINPRAVQDTGGHGFEGWQSTSFINPDLVAKIGEGDRTFRQVLLEAATSFLGRKRTVPLLERALAQLRLVEFLDPNDRNNRREKPEGIAFIPIGTDGTRRIGLRELLLETCDLFPDRLVIKTGVHATRILFEKKDHDVPRAIGVEIAKGPHLYDASEAPAKAPMGAPRRRYFARHEVIVCGGAFNTPQLLMLSGIGDASHLAKHGITGLCGRDGAQIAPAINLPGVGLNLQDRYEVSVVSTLDKEFSTLKGVSFDPNDSNDPALQEWLRTGTGLYTTNGGTLAILNRSGAESHPEPDLFIFGASAAFRGYYWGWSKELLYRTAGAGKNESDLWSWIILKAYTHNNGGTVRLRSNSPFHQPEINFASFREGPDGWEKDFQALAHAVKLVRKINDHRKTPFKYEVQPGKELRPDDSDPLRDWIQDEAWGHHACGTCRMGSDAWQEDVERLSDKNAVLDSKFRVHGVRGLRVVDASVFPKIPGYFIVTPVFMISEKAADTILADSQSYPDALKCKEAAAIRERREAARIGSESVPESTAAQEPSAASTAGARSVAGAERRLPAHTVGLAFSGGGIRSATFCLGVLQALARKDKLRRVDLLSTVSGGLMPAGSSVDSTPG